MPLLSREEILAADRVLKLLSISESRGATEAEAAAFREKAATLAERNGYARRCQDYRDREGKAQ